MNLMVLFSKQNLRGGYDLIMMVEHGEFKIAFKIHHGHIQIKVMPSRLSNLAVTLQCLMNYIAPYNKSLCLFSCMIFLCKARSCRIM